MAASKVTNLSTMQKFFAGQGGIVVFDTPADYSTAKVSDFSNAKDIGNILEGSFDYTGEDITVDAIRNMQGISVISTKTAGTIAFEWTAMSTDPDIIKKFLWAKEVKDTFTESGTFATGSKMYGFGVDIPIVECPLAIVNQTFDQTILIPKASIASSPIWDTTGQGLLGIRMSVTAEYINTAKTNSDGTVSGLYPCMLIDGAVQYATDDVVTP